MDTPTTVPGTPPVTPNYSTYNLPLAVYMHTGTNAAALVHEYLAAPMTTRHVALDIEARGLGAKSFDIRCVTAAFVDGAGDTHAVLLLSLIHI